MAEHQRVTNVFISLKGFNDAFCEYRPIRLSDAFVVEPIMISRVNPSIPEIKRNEKLVEFRAVYARQFCVDIIKASTNFLVSARLLSVNILTEPINERSFRLQIIQHLSCLTER